MNIENAALEDVKKGYVYDAGAETYGCLICGQNYTKGRIYPADGGYVEAEKAVRHHIRQQHTSMFHYLLDHFGRHTGITEHQKALLTCFHEGMDDRQIAKRLKSGSLSTIRHYRFSFRQKEKQAKLFLAIMELLQERKKA